MRKIFLLTLLSLISLQLQAQASQGAIGDARKQLLQAFLDDNLAEAGLWMDSLAKLASPVQVSLSWDERWLLYFWNESYGNFFQEVAEFDDRRRQLESIKNQPPGDSLFEWIDYRMFEERHRYFDNIQRAFLNSEEKAFATLQLEYLLRMNQNETEFASKIDAFLGKFPNSRFNTWLKSIRPVTYKPTRHGFNLSGGLATGYWIGQLDHNFTQPWGVDLDLSYWQNRWNFLFRFAYLSAKVKRDLPLDDYLYWPKNEQAGMVLAGLELGYDLVNNNKLRLFPSSGFYYKKIGPPDPDEDEEPNPDYYSAFKSWKVGWNIGITADVKLHTQKKSNAETGKGSYHGFRLKLSYQPLSFHKDWYQLRGNFIFFALHYNFFGHNVSY